MRPPDDGPPNPSLADAIRISLVGFYEEISNLLIGNVAWALLTGGVIYAIGRWPIALLLIPFIGPLTCGLARMATGVARERVVKLGDFIAGVRERFVAKLGLAALQALVLGIALADLLVAPAIGGIMAAVSMVLALYVAASTIAYGLVFWTLLADPEHGALEVPQIGRLALAVVLSRPAQVGVLLVLAVLGIGVMASLVVPILFLPSILLIAIAGYVVPAADRIRETARARG